MYDTEIYATGDCKVLLVKRKDMIEFEGDAPHGPTYCIIIQYLYDNTTLLADLAANDAAKSAI